MFFEGELHFLCDVYKKHHICIETIPVAEFSDYLNRRDSDAVFGVREGVWTSILWRENLSACTVYRFSDPFERSFLYLLLPDADTPTLLFIGPYLTEPISQQRLLELGVTHGIPSQKQRYLLEYYATIPVIGKEDPLWVMFNTFCERIWKSPSFSFSDVIYPQNDSEYPVAAVMDGHTAANILVDVKALEERYAFENEIMRAVTMGQLHMERRLFALFDVKSLEKRTKDLLRNAKNYGIIMNTLFRKAAETGGVHPLYLDRVSSDYAMKIERLSELSAVGGLMSEMFRVYCRLVRKHSVQQYSLVVQRTLLLIDADLSADLSPHLLAESQGISLGYLSTLFKKETGETVTEYVRKKRIEYAKYLLKKTNLQIQTVALQCGVMDVQYFSKMFKKQVGKTPTEYRESMLL